MLVGNAQEATFRRVPAEMDLISAQTNCIMRDSRGFIWLATQCGMSRFDGYRFTTFLHDDKNSASLPDNSVEIIQEDGFGRLLVKTAKGYCVFDNMTQTFSSDINEYFFWRMADYYCEWLMGASKRNEVDIKEMNND